MITVRESRHVTDTHAVSFRAIMCCFRNSTYIVLFLDILNLSTIQEVKAETLTRMHEIIYYSNKMFRCWPLVTGCGQKSKVTVL